MELSVVVSSSNQFVAFGHLSSIVILYNTRIHDAREDSIYLERLDSTLNALASVQKEHG